MHCNYQRLFQELTQLLKDEDVQDNLDENLKERVSKLVEQKRKSMLQKNISELAKTSQRQTFSKQVSEDMCHKFQKIFLKDFSAQPKMSAKSSNEGLKIKNSKRSSSKCKQKSRERINSNESKILRQKSSQRNTKQSTKNMSHVSSASKIKHKLSSKEPGSSVRLATESQREKKERSSSKVKVYYKNKQNAKIYHTKPSKKVSYQKTESDSDHSEIIFSKNTSHSKTKGRDVMKKLSSIETQPSRFSISNSKKNSLSLEKQKRLLETIEQKKEEVIEERLVLEDTIKMLQQKIHKEKSILHVSETRIIKIKHEINKIDVSQKERSMQGKISRKKSESFFVQAKQIESKIIEANKSNESILQNITEEKYLLQMYKKVIEEMKSQLRVEKEEKITLKKKLSLLKNSEKKVIEKSTSKEALSDQLFNSMKEILKKWD